MTYLDGSEKSVHLALSFQFYSQIIFISFFEIFTHFRVKWLEIIKNCLELALR